MLLDSLDTLDEAMASLLNLGTCCMQCFKTNKLAGMTKASQLHLVKLGVGVAKFGPGKAAPNFENSESSKNAQISKSQDNKRRFDNF